MLRSAKTRAARTSLNCALLTYDSAMKFQCPGGVGELTPSAHLVAIASWLRVRFSTVFLTSAVSCAMRGDDVDGGGPGRSRTISSGVIIQAFTLPKTGSMGGRGGNSWLFHGISPRAVAVSAIACHIAGDPPAVLIPSEAARATNTAATACPRAKPAAMSLAVALPARIANCCCSFAFCVI